MSIDDIEWKLVHNGYADLADNGRVVNAIQKLFVDDEGDTDD